MKPLAYQWTEADQQAWDDYLDTLDKLLDQQADQPKEAP
jgi:hypothetical protein